MRLQFDEILRWKMLFFSLLFGYCLLYAPYGTNETDGGFLTGLAWQLLNGKVLYQDVLYVRPPLPVWLRAAELYVLPEAWAVLGERWIFFGKVALYAWLGAAVLAEGRRRWLLAVFGFVVSVHCFTPMAWHTVDGILFAALAFWLLFRVNGPQPITNKQQPITNLRTALAGVAVVAAMLCKQSFYPLAAVFVAVLLLRKDRRELIGGLSGLLVAMGLFFTYLWYNNLLDGYRQMVGGAASGGQAFEHGVLDYFRINPWVAGVSAVLLPVVGWWFWQKEPARGARVAWWAWVLWLAVLAHLYLRAIWLRQDFTAPFAQARLLFDVAAAWGLWCVSPWSRDRRGRGAALRFFALLSVSWCAGISWGYNLPILFAVPMIFAVGQISERLWAAVAPGRSAELIAMLALVGLLAVFRNGYEFVYRDGRRSAMTEDLGAVFPALTGIRTDATTAVLYRELQSLAGRYGPHFKTLPSFPQANFLTRSYPPLPLDWVAKRETNGDYTLLMKDLEKNRPVFFVEKSYGRSKIENDPELTFTRKILTEGQLVAETPHFWIVRYE